MIVFEANYSKKLGLPGYSSHQYSVTVRSELSDLSQIDVESAKIHSLLQRSVDREIQKTGYLPDHKNGSNGHSHFPNGNGNGHAKTQTNGSAESWACSEKQKELMTKIVADRKLSSNYLELLAQERFKKSIRAVTRPEASILIEESLERFGDGPPTRSRSKPSNRLSRLTANI